MILKSTSGKTYTAHFLHRAIGKEASEKYPGLAVVRREGEEDEREVLWQVETIATIHPTPCATKERPCGTPGTMQGVALCSKKDWFSRAVGRKIALERAMKTIPREEHRGLWESYFARHGKPR